MKFLRYPFQWAVVVILLLGMAVTCAGAVVVWCCRQAFPEE